MRDTFRMKSRGRGGMTFSISALQLKTKPPASWILPSRLIRLSPAGDSRAKLPEVSRFPERPPTAHPHSLTILRVALQISSDLLRINEYYATVTNKKIIKLYLFFIRGHSVTPPSSLFPSSGGSESEATDTLRQKHTHANTKHRFRPSTEALHSTKKTKWSTYVSRNCLSHDDRETRCSTVGQFCDLNNFELECVFYF